VGGVSRGFLYNGSTFTDIIYPVQACTAALGIDGSNIVGSAIVGGRNRGFLYNGLTFTDIIYPGATFTEAYGIDGSNIVGPQFLTPPTRGFLYNGSTFTDIIYPPGVKPLPSESMVQTLLGEHFAWEYL
jgi:hypothetical protein